MKALNPQELLSALQTRGLAPADATLAFNEAGTPRPWYISLLLGASGWLAGAFLLVFVALVFSPDSAGAEAISALVLLASAWGLFKVDREGTFTSQLALALSVAGQCLMLFVLNEDNQSIAVIAGTAVALQTVMVLLMPNPLHRSMSTLFAMIAWAMMLRFGLFGEPKWNSSSYVSPSRGYALLGWALAWGPMLVALWWLLRTEAQWVARGWAAMTRPVLQGLIIGLAFGTIASQPFENLVWWGHGAEVQLNGLALWPMLSAGAALGAVAAAFTLRSRALMGACILAVLLHISHFYYALGTSLLLKSLLMIAMGVALLLASRAVTKGHTGNEAMNKHFTVARLLILFGALLVLGAVNYAIYGKERIKSDGEIVYLQLVPVDPRSLMQGDYMALRFALVQELEMSLAPSASNPAQSPREGEVRWVSVALASDHVATLSAAEPAPPLKLRYRIRNGQVWLGTNAFFFQEGDAERFSSARYGEFRVDRSSGEAVLVGLRDDALTAL